MDRESKNHRNKIEMKGENREIQNTVTESSLKYGDRKSKKMWLKTPVSNKNNFNPFTTHPFVLITLSAVLPELHRVTLSPSAVFSRGSIVVNPPVVPVGGGASP